ncbi:MAG: phospho-N-acetylmuramoyl-pentapeptide-transferase [Clostridia bacterium]|nr:phospho-N-acetylmuramoyl-pentapeptide-transferase [Clostridia bacterium]
MILAFLIAGVITMLISPPFIKMLRRLKYGQVERAEGPHANSAKEGTPTIGGIVFIIGIIAAVLLMSIYNIAFEYSIPSLIIMIAFGLVGFLDDFIKVKQKRNLGLRAWQKIVAQFFLAFVAAFFAYKSDLLGSVLYDPIFGRVDLGVAYIPFIMFVVIAIVNSANLTDGLDGLLSGTTLIYSLAMGVLFLYFAGAFDLGDKMPIFLAERDGMLNMGIFAFAVAGGCIGFLKSNSYPARVFMGDTGSMALGGAISAMVIYSRSPLIFLLMGSCIVASAVSDVLQVGSFKLRGGKRVFKMAPLHHHFEKLGYPETKIVSGYMIVTAACCLAALALFF